MFYPEMVKSHSELSDLEKEMLSQELGFEVSKLSLSELNYVLHNKHEIDMIAEEQAEWERNDFCMTD